MQVAIYARVSTTNQKKEATIDSQLRVLKEYAQQQSWCLLPEHLYTDEGVSGARLDRPALDRLRDVAKRGEIDAVVISSPDRLARNYAHQWLLIEEFEKSNVQVIFLQNPFGDTPQGKLLVQMQGMIAEYERAAIAERTRRGRLEKARRGEFIPWAYHCYGYKYLAKRAGLPPQVVIAEAEADVVRKIFRWLVEEQMSLRQITKRLNQMQVPTPSGKNSVWQPGSVRAIVTNRVYAGQARYNYRMPAVPKYRKAEASQLKNLKTGRSYRSEPELIWSESPALITAELFDKAQLQLRRNAEAAQKMYQPKSRRYLLRTRVRCGLCGLAMTGIRHESVCGQYEYLYYECTGRRPLTCGRAKKCSARLVRADRLDDVVWSALIELLKKPALIPQLHQQWRATKQTDLGQLNAQRELLATRRKRLEGQIQKLVDAYQQEVITLMELKNRRKKLEADIERLRTEENQFTQQEHKLIGWKQLMDNVEKFTSLIGKNLDDLGFEDRQVLVQCLIEKVVVTGEDVDIFYVLPFAEPPRLLYNDGNGSKEELGQFYRLRLAGLHHVPPEEAERQLPKKT